MIAIKWESEIMIVGDPNINISQLVSISTR